MPHTPKYCRAPGIPVAPLWKLVPPRHVEHSAYGREHSPIPGAGVSEVTHGHGRRRAFGAILANQRDRFATCIRSF
jgi:hypothetical protein